MNWTSHYGAAREILSGADLLREHLQVHCDTLHGRVPHYKLIRCRSPDVGFSMNSCLSWTSDDNHL